MVESTFLVISPLTAGYTTTHCNLERMLRGIKDDDLREVVQDWANTARPGDFITARSQVVILVSSGVEAIEAKRYKLTAFRSGSFQL